MSGEIRQAVCGDENVGKIFITLCQTYYTAQKCLRRTHLCEIIQQHTAHKEKIGREVFSYTTHGSLHG
jgi:hypothetical protein